MTGDEQDSLGLLLNFTTGLVCDLLIVACKGDTYFCCTAECWCTFVTCDVEEEPPWASEDDTKILASLVLWEEVEIAAWVLEEETWVCEEEEAAWIWLDLCNPCWSSLAGKGSKETLGFWIEDPAIRPEEIPVWTKSWGFFGTGPVWPAIRLDEWGVWVGSTFFEVASGNLLIMLASFSSLSPGRGLDVGVSMVDPRGDPLAPLLITARASEIESSDGGWKERSSSSESSKQIVSGAGVQLELAGVQTGVLELSTVAQPELTEDVQVFCSFFGLESWELKFEKRQV